MRRTAKAAMLAALGAALGGGSVWLLDHAAGAAPKAEVTATATAEVKPNVVAEEAPTPPIPPPLAVPATVPAKAANDYPDNSRLRPGAAVVIFDQYKTNVPMMFVDDPSKTADDMQVDVGVLATVVLDANLDDDDRPLDGIRMVRLVLKTGRDAGAHVEVLRKCLRLAD